MSKPKISSARNKLEKQLASDKNVVSICTQKQGQETVICVTVIKNNASNIPGQFWGYKVITEQSGGISLVASS